jgi:hypothetical protein
MIKFKKEEDKLMFTQLHPILIMIFADMAYYAQSKHNIDLVVTDTISTLEDDKKLGRKSSAHRRSIALDIRTKNLDPFIVAEIIDYVNKKPEYDEYKYVSWSGARRLAYYHVGTNEHIHLAIHSTYGID